MAKTKYMTKRSGSDVWQLYMRVPQDIQKVYGKSLVRESLGETDKRKAEFKKDLRVAEIKAEWQRIRSSVSGIYIPTDDEFDNWVDLSIPGPRYEQHFLDAHFFYEEPKPTVANLKKEIHEADAKIMKSVEHTLDSINQNVSSEVKNKLLQSAKAKYLLKLRSELNDQLGLEPQALNRASDLMPQSGNRDEWNADGINSISLFEAVTLYQQSSDWKKLKTTSHKDYKRALNLLLRCFEPCQTVGSLKPNDYDRINQVIHNLPKGLPKNGDLDSLINTNKNEGQLSPNSKNKYVSVILSFFSWVEKSAYIRKNYARLYLEHIKAETVVDPLPLSDTDIRTFFTNMKLDFVCWISLIGLFTGMRRNEICQLSPDDIIEYDGIWVFQLTEKADHQSLKKDGAHRIVPIHSFLLKLGFIDFVNNNSNTNGRIFPELTFTDTDNWSRKFVSKFDRRMDKLGLKPKDKKTRKSFHGFRYAMTDHLLDQGIEEGIVDAILGWSSDERKQLLKAMRVRYSGRSKPQVPIEKLQEAIETRQFPWLVEEIKK